MVFFTKRMMLYFIGFKKPLKLYLVIFALKLIKTINLIFSNYDFFNLLYDL